VKILYLAGDYYKIFYEAHIRGIIYNFPSHHQIFLLTPMGWKFNENGNVKIIKIEDSKSKQNPIIGRIKVINYLTKIGLKVLKNEQIDMIYSRDGIASIVTLLINVITKIPFALEINSIMSNDQEVKLWVRKNRIIIKLLSFLIKLLEKYLFCKASLLFVCSSGNLKKEFIEKKYKVDNKKIISVTNAADPDILRPMDKSEARRMLGLNSGLFYIVYVGVIDVWRGVEQLIKAIPLIMEKVQNVCFLIVGDGPEKENIIQEAVSLGVHEKIIFAGRVPFEKVSLFINAGDICVATFTGDQSNPIRFSPLKLFEYMACSRPIVSTNIPGWLDEYISETGSGILIPSEDPQELANAIIRLLKDKTLREEMGRKGREAVVNKYNWVNIARRTAEECEKALAERKK